MSERCRRFGLQFRQQECIAELSIHAADAATAEQLLKADALALAAAIKEWAEELGSPCWELPEGASLPIASWDGRRGWGWGPK